MIKISILPIILLVLAVAAMGIGLVLAKPAVRRVLLWILGAVILAAILLWYCMMPIASIQPEQPLVQSESQVVAHQRNNSWAQMGLSLLGMMVIIWIAYSVANATTKGYYSAILAVLAILAVVVVGLLVIA